MGKRIKAVVADVLDKVADVADKVADVVAPVAMRARVYTFKAYHSRGSLWVSFKSPGKGDVVLEASHCVTMPVAGDTMTLQATTDDVAGHTLRFKCRTQAGRYAYVLAGHKGVWTIYAQQMPAMGIDGQPPAMLYTSLVLQGAPAGIVASATTAAAIAAANSTHEPLVTPSGIADVQRALGDKAVA